MDKKSYLYIIINLKMIYLIFINKFNFSII